MRITLLSNNTLLNTEMTVPATDEHLGSGLKQAQKYGHIGRYTIYYIDIFNIQLKR